MAQSINDDVDRLSRGKSTHRRIGNRGIGHRLTNKERILFEAAKKNGFLKLPASGSRKNVINVYRIWCSANAKPCVLRSPTGNGIIDLK